MCAAKRSTSSFAIKSLETLHAEMNDDNRLRRVLGPTSLTALGVGAIIGAGIFVMTGRAAALDAGPAIVVSYLVAALGCTLAALCYAEFAAAVPVAGSAYTYAYATIGELFAWIIGWDLILEYAMACATVAASWSHYLDELLRVTVGWRIPKVIATDPFTSAGASWLNLPAVLIILTVTAVLVVGIRESALVNTFLVLVKLFVVLFVVLVGWTYIQPDNWTGIPVTERHLGVDPTAKWGLLGQFGLDRWLVPIDDAVRSPFAPYGLSGIMLGASIVFFAFIGFDSISTHAEEARRPQRDVPIAILASLVLCTVLYVAVAAVITGMEPYPQIDVEAAVAASFRRLSEQHGSVLLRIGRPHCDRRASRYDERTAGDFLESVARVSGHVTRRIVARTVRGCPCHATDAAPFNDADRRGHLRGGCPDADCQIGRDGQHWHAHGICDCMCGRIGSPLAETRCRATIPLPVGVCCRAPRYPSQWHDDALPAAGHLDSPGRVVGGGTGDLLPVWPPPQRPGEATVGVVNSELECVIWKKQRQRSVTRSRQGQRFQSVTVPRRRGPLRRLYDWVLRWAETPYGTTMNLTELIPRVLLALTILPACDALDITPISAAAFPDRPIRIIVYTGAGGLLDTTARLFVDVARKYTDATMIVENRPGAGGIVAFDSVLQSAPDGYTLLACTKSNIAKITLVARDDLWQGLDWRAILLVDPECLIVPSEAGIESFQDLIADARQRPRGQIWLGPGSGGLDHVTAEKLWDHLNIRGRWIPYASGGEAMTALMGDQGQAYVGNPADALDNPKLQILAISSSTRLPAFPDIPILSELGVTDMDQQFMWRGFALKQRCPQEALAWYDHLFRQVAGDPEWRTFWQQAGADVLLKGPIEFAQQIAADRAEFEHFHHRLGMISAKESTTFARDRFAWPVAAVAWLLVGASWWIAWRRGMFASGNARQSPTPWLIMLGLQLICLAMFAMTRGFPSGEGISSGGVPRFWLGATVAVTPLVVRGMRNSVSPSDEQNGHPQLVVGLLAIMLIYLVGLAFAGFYVASAIFLLTVMIMLGERRIGVATVVVAGWLLLAYFVFEQTLHLPLPQGSWFNGA